jgi:cytidine deaminase
LTDEELLSKAQNAMLNAYSPYSKFRVGAALLCGNGSILCGCNIENASYGATICAERAAVSAAVTAGKKDFVKIAVISDGDDFCMPCGICRQVLAEFNKELTVLCANNKGTFRTFLVCELLPYSFEL